MTVVISEAACGGHPIACFTHPSTSRPASPYCATHPMPLPRSWPPTLALPSVSGFGNGCFRRCAPPGLVLHPSQHSRRLRRHASIVTYQTLPWYLGTPSRCTFKYEIHRLLRTVLIELLQHLPDKLSRE